MAVVETAGEVNCYNFIVQLCSPLQNGAARGTVAQCNDPWLARMIKLCVYLSYILTISTGVC